MSGPERARLTLKFATRSKLWADVVHPLGESVFVESEQVLAPGTRVELEILAPAIDPPLVVEGTVAEARPARDGAAAGLVLRLAESAVARCREVLAVPRNEQARLGGRAEARAEGQLPAKVLVPVALAGCTVRALSSNGLTLKAERVWPVSTPMQVAIAVGKDELVVSGTVTWSRPDLGLCGLQLRDVPLATLERLLEALGGAAAPAVAKEARVVIADDDAEILDLVSKVVKGAGHQVLTAARGDHALELVRRERPSLVFLDILMPGLDGLEVCRALRADVGLRQVAVVLLSAMSEQRLEEVARSVSADGWLMKPMRIGAVRELLKKLLR